MYDLILDASNQVPFVMVDTAGTEVTGLGGTFTVALRKAGGSFGASAGSKAELGNGWYLYTATAGECDTAGPLAVMVTGSGAAQQNLVAYVRAAALTVDDIATGVAAEFAAVGIVPIGDGATLDDLLDDLDTAHGAGSWEGMTVQATADAVYGLAPTGAAAVGSLGAQVAAVALEATAQAVLEDTGTTLPAAIAAIEPGGGSYAGDGTGYYTDTIDDGTNPLDGVRVQLYTAQNRVGPAYEAYTNALGVFEMWPDPGTYYRWLDLAGFSFTQDVAVVVTEP